MRRFFTIALFCLVTTNCYSQYYTGQKVFKDKFPSETKDYNQDTYIKIENASGDIIVAVENTYTGQVIQHAYITSRDTYEFKYIQRFIFEQRVCIQLNQNMCVCIMILSDHI